MNFATPNFFFFLLIVTVAVHFISSPRVRKLVLLLASYIFYATWNAPFILLLLFSTSVDYFLSKRIAASKQGSNKKLFLLTGITVNLLILGLFKYFNFFVDSANLTLGSLFQHLHAIRHLKLVLPLGISFYTFEAISYLLDVYRGDKPARDFYDYNFYIMYFPHLISGPIVRYGELSTQLPFGIGLPSLQRFYKAFELIILGLMFKVIVADTAAGLVDPVFQDLQGSNISSIWLAWAAFTTQIYFDFMGYTHIARGVSLLFNIELPLNFNHPYNATNVSNFWQRWHISLSRWIRDYLFIPLGGSRSSNAKTLLNLMVTMTIAGAWHGAAWTFIIWGIYHGLLLLVYHVVAPARTSIKKFISVTGVGLKTYHYASIVLTFFVVSFGWIWFRSPSLLTATIFINKLCRINTLLREVGAHFAVGDFEFLLTLTILILLCLTGPLIVESVNKVRDGVPSWIKVQAATAALILCYIFAGTEVNHSSISNFERKYAFAYCRSKY